MSSDRSNLNYLSQQCVDLLVADLVRFEIGGEMGRLQIGVHWLQMEYLTEQKDSSMVNSKDTFI